MRTILLVIFITFVTLLNAQDASYTKFYGGISYPLVGGGNIYNRGFIGKVTPFPGKSAGFEIFKPVTDHTEFSFGVQRGRDNYVVNGLKVLNDQYHYRYDYFSFPVAVNFFGYSFDEEKYLTLQMGGALKYGKLSLNDKNGYDELAGYRINPFMERYQYLNLDLFGGFGLGHRIHGFGTLEYTLYIHTNPVNTLNAKQTGGEMSEKGITMVARAYPEFRFAISPEWSDIRKNVMRKWRAL